jgi:hypothetical protein
LKVGSIQVSGVGAIKMLKQQSRAMPDGAPKVADWRPTDPRQQERDGEKG